MENKILFAKVNTTNYKGIYQVVEILGSCIALKINGLTTDFNINEIEKFCSADGLNFTFKPNK
jgi:hypothetical protein